MVNFPLMFQSEWREFPLAPIFQEKKMRARFYMLLKSHASPDMLSFSICNKEKTSNFAHEQTPLFKDTTDSVLRHREVCRAKDLSAPPRSEGVEMKYSDRNLLYCHIFYITYLGWSVFETNSGFGFRSSANYRLSRGKCFL